MRIGVFLHSTQDIAVPDQAMPPHLDFGAFHRSGTMLIHTQALVKSNTNRAYQGRRRGRPRRNEDLGPTPETAAKLEADVLSVLLETEQITVDQEAAGRELFSMWRALQRGFLPQMKLSLAGPNAGRKQARSPFARMSDFEAGMWTARYKPWAAVETKTIVVNVPRLSRLALTRRIIESNIRPLEIARTFLVSSKCVLSAFGKALDSYCSLRRVKKLLT